MLLIAVCDDEKYYRDKLRTLLEVYLTGRCLEFTIDTFSSGEEFLSRSENAVKYQIIFMDISMNDLDGIKTAMQIRSFHSDTHLVFVTAYINYVLEGYKVNAVRYILKDMLEDSLSECMDAILEKMRLRRISFDFIEGERALYTDNLLYVESQKHKLFFYYLESKPVIYRMYDKLDLVEQRLNEYGFLRIHKSYLVNMRHIQKINHYMAGLDTGMELPIPRLRYQQVKEAYVEYKGAF